MKPDELKGRLRGVQVVLITPMKEDLSVDLDGLAANVSTVLEFAVGGLVVSGTYGEFPTLTSDERVDMFRVVARAAGARAATRATTRAAADARGSVSSAGRWHGRGDSTRARATLHARRRCSVRRGPPDTANAVDTFAWPRRRRREG